MKGGLKMATKSILKNVTIHGRSNCRKFISALEHAEDKKSKEVTISKPVRQVKSSEEIRKFLGDMK